MSNVTCSKVDCCHLCTVGTCNIKNQNIVDVYKHIVVTGKVKYHVLKFAVHIVNLAVVCNLKVKLHGHTKPKVCFLAVCVTCTVRISIGFI